MAIAGSPSRTNGVAPTPVSCHRLARPDRRARPRRRVRSPMPDARPTRRRTRSRPTEPGRRRRSRAPAHRGLVVNGPRSRSATASSRTPSAERTARRAPSASNTAGMSDAGSACTTLPPIVPRLRTCRSPIPRAHSGIASRPAGSSALASSLHVVERPDVHRAVALLDAAQLEPGDVDDERRAGDAQLHDRDERLPAGDRLRIGLAEQLEGVVDVRRARVPRRGGNHADPPTARIDSTMPW